MTPPVAPSALSAPAAMVPPLWVIAPLACRIRLAAPPLALIAPAVCVIVPLAAVMVIAWPETLAPSATVSPLSDTVPAPAVAVMLPAVCVMLPAVTVTLVPPANPPPKLAAPVAVTAAPPPAVTLPPVLTKPPFTATPAAAMVKAPAVLAAKLPAVSEMLAPISMPVSEGLLAAASVFSVRLPVALVTAASTVMPSVASRIRLPVTAAMSAVRTSSASPAGPVVALTVPPPVGAGDATVSLPPAAALVMRMRRGSIRIEPAAPFGAVTSTGAWLMFSTAWPEISTNPPLPPCGPPRADSVPSTRLTSVELIAMVPPWPRTVASARIVAPRSTVVLRAMVWLRPTPVVPTRTVPPPAPPEASSVAPAATRTERSDCTAMVPPRWPAAPVASTLPVTSTPPPVARSATWPGWPASVLARMVPVLRTRPSMRSPAADAVSSTEPPLASIRPSLVTTPAPPPRTAWVMSMLISPSPARSSVKASAPARTTRPSRARISPVFETRGPASTAMPRSMTVMRPSLRTCAPGCAAWSKRMRPAMKFSLVIPGAVAISAPTSTWAPRVNRMPDWLTSATPPLAVMRPAITEGSGPTTRFSVQLPALGCWNCTVCPAPTLKPCQLIAARSVPCVMVVCVPVCAMPACPATTCPPVGACACAPKLASATGSSAVVRNNHARGAAMGPRRSARRGATEASGRGAARWAMGQNLTRVRI